MRHIAALSRQVRRDARRYALKAMDAMIVYKVTVTDHGNRVTALSPYYARRI
jgi:hypothetical protein